jgi:hypothetical protein
VIESSLPARRQSRGEWAVGVSLSLIAHLALIGLLWDRAVGPVADVPAFIEVPVEVIVEPSTSTSNEAAASDTTAVETADEDKPDPERSEAPAASPAEQLAIAEPEPPAAIGPALAQAEGSLAGISQSLQSRGDVPASDGLPNSPSMLTEPALTAQPPPGAQRSVLSPQVRSKEPRVEFANKESGHPGSKENRGWHLLRSRSASAVVHRPMSRSSTGHSEVCRNHAWLRLGALFQPGKEGRLLRRLMPPHTGRRSSPT